MCIAYNHTKINSPSLPASQALINSTISLRLIKRCNNSNLDLVLIIGFKIKFDGIIGKF